MAGSLVEEVWKEMRCMVPCFEGITFSIFSVKTYCSLILAANITVTAVSVSPSIKSYQTERDLSLP